MKTRIAMMTAIVIITMQFTFAGEPAKRFTTEDQKVAFATKNLLIGLRSTNLGVIESAIRVTAQMKMRYVAADVSKLVKEMNTVWQKHPSGTIRYKAYIAMSICENPEWYANENSIVTANEENFFQAASVHMQKHLLSVNVESGIVSK
ncbi:MAG: hypothetical protein Q8L88_14765 [Bacteroidota bacterium]|nr:hypothetical protein [Bacteroidota bacterium]